MEVFGAFACLQDIFSQGGYSPQHTPQQVSLRITLSEEEVCRAHRAYYAYRENYDGRLLSDNPCPCAAVSKDWPRGPCLCRSCCSR